VLNVCLCLSHSSSAADPPPALLAQVFPWVEAELAALTARQLDYRLAQDVALRNFLEVLIWFRTILLQDVAILYTMFPHANIFSYPPFCSPVFRDFAATSVARIKEIEEEAQLAFKNLPENLVTSLRGAVTTVQLENRKADDENKARLDALQGSVLQMSRALNQLGGCQPYQWGGCSRK
jgi:Centromere DNA-binding protein complex CBF3 subunit, domain 2